jgi:plastocyanin
MTGRVAIAALGGSLALAAGIPAALGENGQVREVSIPGKAFAPGLLQVIVGDTVVWRNGDATDHTVTDDDGAFDSGYLGPGLTFSLVFRKLGRYSYHCTIHRFMRGEVVVVPVALQPPPRPVVSGGRVVLQGLAPSGTHAVTVEQLGRSAPGKRRAVPAGDGSFTVTLRAVKPVFVAARVGRLSSLPVRIFVAPRVNARLRSGTVGVATRPSRPGARVVLQRYVRERFAWVTVTRARLDSSSRASLPLPPGRLGRFRVVVRGGSGWADGSSGNIVRR